jgi:ribosomal protein S6
MPTKSPSLDNAKSYELLLILAGSLSETEQKKELEKWESEINKIGSIKNKTTWTGRILAYKVDGHKTGTYWVCNFLGEPKKIAELQNLLRLDLKVIRSLIYVTPKHYIWKDYSSEDLECDLSKILPKPIEKPRFKKFENKPKTFHHVRKAVVTSDTEETKVAEEAAPPTQTSEQLDKKLDDILGDL